MESRQLEIFSRIVNKILKEKGFLLVEIKSDNNYNFKVFIDKHIGNITIDDCVTVSRSVEHLLEDVFENFSLEVSSPGLTSPFKIPEQYKKNIGKKVEILKTDGKKEKGILKDVKQNKITVEINGRKETKEIDINFDNIKKAKLVLKF